MLREFVPSSSTNIHPLSNAAACAIKARTFPYPFHPRTARSRLVLADFARSVAASLAADVGRMLAIASKRRDSLALTGNEGDFVTRDSCRGVE